MKVFFIGFYQGILVLSLVWLFLYVAVPFGRIISAKITEPLPIPDTIERK